MNQVDVLAFIKASRKQHYVYVLRKPNGEPFYVGVGTRRRLLDHEMFARHSTIDSHKLRVIRKLSRLGHSIDYTIHAFFDMRSDAEKVEAGLISDIGRRDLRTGPLTNITAGGEGAPSPSEATLSSRSIALKLAWSMRDKIAATAHLRQSGVMERATAGKIGKKKRKSSEPRDNSWVTPEFRAKQSARMKADPPSRRPGVAAKISAAKLGKPINSWMKTLDARRRFARGLHPRARPIEIEGKLFACIQDAVEQLPVPRATLDYWLKNGRDGVRFLD